MRLSNAAAKSVQRRSRVLLMRRAIASLIMLALLAAWIGLAATIGSRLTHAPRWLQLGFYVVAGIGWIVPLRPVFAWMNANVKADEDT